MLEFAGAAVPLNPSDIDSVAARLGCDAAAVRAVMTVETGGHSGYLADRSGRPRILFEAAHFSRQTDGQYDDSHPNISSPEWDASLYIGGAAEYDRLAEAVALDRRAALESASWGLFQILGENYRLCGNADVEAFVSACEASEGAQLMAFAGFVRSVNGMQAALRDHDWAGFARRYNGVRYAANAYDTKLASAYARAVGGGTFTPAGGLLEIGDTGPRVASLQDALNRAGANPALIGDGQFGRATEIALTKFQTAHGLTSDGVFGPASAAALGLG